MNILISDTRPLIALAKTGLVSHLKNLFEYIIIPEEVFKELRVQDNKPGAKILKKAIDTNLIKVFKLPSEKVLKQLYLDPGEKVSISLAVEMKKVLLIDETRGRKVASELGVSVIGIGRILIELKKKSLIESVRYSLESLANSGYRISNKLSKKIIHYAGE